MFDCKKQLGIKFRKRNRFKNFGECINAISINGIRGVTCSKITFRYPVVGFTGMNGSGKTTIVQLLSCAHRKVQRSGYERYSIGDFFVSSIADDKLYSKDSEICYFYNSDKDDEPKEKFSTIYRKSKWAGYSDQPMKTSIFLGPSTFMPKYERKDLSIYESNHLSFEERFEINNGAEWVSKVLESDYGDVFIQSVKGISRSTELAMANRLNASYSENNMGFGERRIIQIVEALEACPNKSLVVLDEVDVGLHASARRNLAYYLMAVSDRRGHQIFFSTHSSDMISALPEEGRVMITREPDKIKTYTGISSAQIRQALLEGDEKFLIVFVEDRFAEAFLRTIISKHDASILDYIRIYVAGGSGSVKSAVRYLTKCNIRVLGILDGDEKEKAEKNIYTLPGKDKKPEKYIFHDKFVKSTLKERYGIDFDILLSKTPNINYHKYPSIIATEIGSNYEIVLSECMRSFVDSRSENWSKYLIDVIEENIIRVR